MFFLKGQDNEGADINGRKSQGTKQDNVKPCEYIIANLHMFIASFNSFCFY